MSTKEKIKIFAIENNIAALEVLKDIFENNEKYELKCIKVSGNDSQQVEKTRDEDKEIIFGILMKEPFDILILDLLLRDNVHVAPEKIEGDDYKGIETVLSLEVARQLKETPGKQEFLPVIISSSRKCNNQNKFRVMKEKHEALIPEDAVFIFKPADKSRNIIYRNCPIFSQSGSPVCNKEQKDPEGCSQKTCFVELLTKYYEVYTEKNGKKRI